MIHIFSKQKKQGLAFILLALISWVPHASANPADLETGRDIFYKHCKACHGDKGDGKTFAANVLNPPPKNFTAEKSKKELTEERMTKSITKGRKGTAMMPWESNLSKDEIQAVVHFIRKKLMRRD